MTAKKFYEILMNSKHDDHDEVYEKLYKMDSERIELFTDYPETWVMEYVSFPDGFISWEEYSNSETCETQGAECGYELHESMERLMAETMRRKKELANG